jgi:radical SAM superfamily enzyme YgiQ (UPF0313 family)
MTRFLQFDIAVIGEGEVAFFELREAVGSGKTLAGIRGLYYREGSHLVHTGDRSEVLMDLDALGVPAWDLLPPARKLYRVMS